MPAYQFPSLCPRCHENRPRVIEIQRLSNGTRRRRHRCRCCDHRWSTWDGPIPPPKSGHKIQFRSARTPLSADEVLVILTSDASAGQLSHELGRSHRAIRMVRQGATHRSLFPELPRQEAAGQPTCQSCCHWQNGCTYGFPEAGGPFANDCTLYESQ